MLSFFSKKSQPVDMVEYYEREIEKQSWKSLNEKEIEMLKSSTLLWFNLKTNRVVKNRPNYLPQDVACSLQYFRILGTKQDIIDFVKINKQSYESIFGQRELCITTPFNDVEFLCEEAERKITLMRSKDEYVQEELRDFDFDGLFTKVVIVKVIDGDTFIVNFTIKLSELKSSYNGTVNFKWEGRPPSVKVTFQTTIRLYGIDSCEKNFSNGVLAKEETVNELSLSKNIMYCQFLIGQNDKYGRKLAVVYYDSKKKNLFNNFLIKKGIQNNIVYAMCYDGRTKQKFDDEENDE